MLELLLTILAGMLTIAAPCILLPLPILLGASIGRQSRTRPLFIALGFVLTFAALGLALNFLIQRAGLPPNALRHGAAIVLALLALFMIWPGPYEKLMARFGSWAVNRAYQVETRAGTGNFGGFVIGMVVGIVWAPCAGPVLATILALVARQEDLLRAGILLAAYGLGAGIPMLAIAYGGQALTTRIKGVAKYSGALQKIFGIIILLLAIAIYFQYDTIIQVKLLDKI